MTLNKLVDLRDDWFLFYLALWLLFGQSPFEDKWTTRARHLFSQFAQGARVQDSASDFLTDVIIYAHAFKETGSTLFDGHRSEAAVAALYEWVTNAD